MKTISVSNQKGGCGKSTTTINLAGALAHLGKKVLVIDLDPQAHASFGLGITSQAADTSVYNVLTDIPEKKHTLEECVVNVSHNLDIIPSNILLSTLEQELKDKEDAVSKLHQILSTKNLQYDYCIIDCPPSLGFLTFNALRAAELVLVPIDMSVFSLMGVGKLLGMLELIKVKIAHAPRIHALATIFDKRTKYSQTMLTEIKHFFKDQLLESSIRTSVALKKAAFAGVPVIQFDKESNGSVDHLALAKEVLKIEGDLDFENALKEVTSQPIKTSETAPRNPENITTRQPASNRVSGKVKPQELPKPVEAAPKAPANRIQQNGNTPDDIALNTVKSMIRDMRFSLNIPHAREVYVVGDFNDWKIDDESRLRKNNDGQWEKRLSLAPGKYRYKFVVDGQWVLDSQNNEKEQNPYGSFDSILKF